MPHAAKFQLALLSCLLLALSLAPPAAAQRATADGSFERTLSVSGEVDLDVTTGSGYVTIKPGDNVTVRIVGTVRARRGSRADAEDDVRRIAADPPVEQSGNTIRIGRLREPESRDGGISISYDILVPSSTRLRAKSGSGEVNVDGVRGPVDVSTGSGGIKVLTIGGDATARTGSGSIEMAEVGGLGHASTGSGTITARRVGRDFKGSTGSGTIRLDGANGSVELGTGSGDITADAVRGSLRAHTGSGTISAAGDPSGEWKLDAGSGSITVRVPAQAGFELDARADSGQISVSHPLTMRGRISKTEMSGTVRGGGFQLRVQTGSGRIRIE